MSSSSVRCLPCPRANIKNPWMQSRESYSALSPSIKTEIAVDEEWNVTWNSLDERILITVPTARTLSWITDKSKISLVSIWIWRSPSPKNKNMEMISVSYHLKPASNVPGFSVFLYQYPFVRVRRHCNKFAYLSLMKWSRMVNFEKRFSRKKSMFCTYRCVQRYLKPLKSI